MFSYADNTALATQQKDLIHNESTFTDDVNTIKISLGPGSFKPNPTKTDNLNKMLVIFSTYVLHNQGL